MRPWGPKLLAAVAVLVLLGGCHSHPSAFSERDDWPLYDIRGNARSLSLTSTPVRNAQLLPPLYEPWYASRNDVGPSVVAGYDAPSYSSSVTYTRDRQSVRNGRVYDDYDETTYRRTFRESFR